MYIILLVAVHLTASCCVSNYDPNLISIRHLLVSKIYNYNYPTGNDRTKASCQEMERIHVYSTD